MPNSPNGPNMGMTLLDQDIKYAQTQISMDKTHTSLNQRNRYGIVNPKTTLGIYDTSLNEENGFGSSKAELSIQANQMINGPTQTNWQSPK